MKTNYIYGYILSLILLFAACSNEDELQPSNEKDNYFAVSDDATDPESQLRREFHKQEGIHLLFNDTIRHEYIGKDAYGDDIYFTELIDLGYTLNALNTNKYRYESFLTQGEREASVKFLQERILSKINNSLRPYSILLSKKAECYKYYSDVRKREWRSFITEAGMRCVCIGIEDILEANEEEQSKYVNTILETIVKDVIHKADKALLKDFYIISQEYYGVSKKNLGLPNKYDNKALHPFGFLVDTSLFNAPGRTSDLDAFIVAILTTDQESFQTLYGEYPLIMQKYKVFKEILTNLGYIF